MNKNDQLVERNKELICLYEIDKLNSEVGDIDNYFKKLIKVVQNGFQYISLLKVEVEYKNRLFRSENFTKTRLSISREIEYGREEKARITCYYYSPDLTKKATFLAEEERLMYSIAARIGDFLFKYETLSEKNESIDRDEKKTEQTEIRKEILSKLIQKINLDELEINAIYLIGSTKNHTAGENSDIDLIIHHYGNTGKISAWFSGWEACAFEYDKLIYDKNDNIGLFDLHFITDEDIKRKSSYAVMIDSHSNTAKLLIKNNNN